MWDGPGITTRKDRFSLFPMQHTLGAASRGLGLGLTAAPAGIVPVTVIRWVTGSATVGGPPGPGISDRSDKLLPSR